MFELDQMLDLHSSDGIHSGEDITSSERVEGWGTGDFTDMFWGTDDFTEMFPLSLRSHFNPVTVRLVLQKGIPQFPEHQELPDEIIYYCFSFLPLSDICCGVFPTCRHLAHMLMVSGSSCVGDGIIGVGSYLTIEPPPPTTKYGPNSSSLSSEFLPTTVDASHSETSSLSLSSSPVSVVSSAASRLSDTVRELFSNFLPVYDLPATSAAIEETTLMRDRTGGFKYGPHGDHNVVDTFQTKIRAKVHELMRKALPRLIGPPDVALVIGNTTWHKWLSLIGHELKHLLPPYVITLQCASSKVRQPPKGWSFMTSRVFKDEMPSSTSSSSSSSSSSLQPLFQAKHITGDTIHLFGNTQTNDQFNQEGLKAQVCHDILTEGDWNDDEDALMLVFLRLPKHGTLSKQSGVSSEEQEEASDHILTMDDDATDSLYSLEDGKHERRASELVSSVANIAKMCCIATGPSQCGIDYASLVDIATSDSKRVPPW